MEEFGAFRGNMYTTLLWGVDYMRRILSVLVVVVIILAGTGCRGNDSALKYILPVSVTRNNVQITVDPRVELMSIVQYLSSYNELMTTADFKYRSDVDSHFAGYRNHKAVTMYEEMVPLGFKYSTPANFALSLTDGLYLDESVNLSYHVEWGGGGEKNLKDFAAALRDFSKESNFHDFYVGHEDYYRDNVYRVSSLLGEWNYVTELQDYYGMEYQSFNIIPVPLYGGGGGFGPHVERDDRIDIYSILVAFDEEMRGEVPVYGNDYIFKLLQRHEFSHSFVNRITDMYLDEVMELEHLLAPIQAEMDKLNYGSWVTCLNEHIVRAVTVRLAYSDSRSEGSRALARELDSGFVYTRLLVDALAEYENNREAYPDFISFYPRLLETLEINN